MRWHCFLVVLLAPVLLFRAAPPGWADEPIVRLELTQPDIHSVVVVEERTAWLKLTPDATAKLEKLTRTHQGRLLVVTVDGMPALRSRIFAPIESGVLQIDAPPPELRLRLKKIQERPSGKTVE